MKTFKFLAIALLAAASSVAFAGNEGPSGSAAPTKVSADASAAQKQQQTSTSVSNAVTGPSSATNGAATSANQQNITFTSPDKTTIDQTVNGTTTSNQVISGGTNSVVRQEFGDQVIKNTPSVSASALTSSNDTCMGSATGAVNVPGFGLGLGKTYTDGNCVMLKNSRELWNMGMRAASMALMCTDAANKEALELTGYECPQTTREKQKGQKSAAASQEQYTDPVVRARLGLPALTK